MYAGGDSIKRIRPCEIDRCNRDTKAVFNLLLKKHKKSQMFENSQLSVIQYPFEEEHGKSLKEISKT